MNDRRDGQGYEAGRIPDSESVGLDAAVAVLDVVSRCWSTIPRTDSTLPRPFPDPSSDPHFRLPIRWSFAGHNSPVAPTPFPCLPHARINTPIPPVFQEIPPKPGASVFPCDRLRIREICDPHPGHFICEETTSSQGAQVSRVDR